MTLMPGFARELVAGRRFGGAILLPSVLVKKLLYSPRAAGAEERM